jgi:hypothetical protein
VQPLGKEIKATSFRQVYSSLPSGDKDGDVDGEEVEESYSDEDEGGDEEDEEEEEEYSDEDMLEDEDGESGVAPVAKAVKDRLSSIKTVLVKADGGNEKAINLSMYMYFHFNGWSFCSNFIPFGRLDVTLGTLFDRYHDEQQERQLLQEQVDNKGAVSPQIPLNQVLHWGIGDVRLQDVLLASAGDGTYNSTNL